MKCVCGIVRYCEYLQARRSHKYRMPRSTANSLKVCVTSIVRWLDACRANSGEQDRQFWFRTEELRWIKYLPPAFDCRIISDAWVVCSARFVGGWGSICRGLGVLTLPLCCLSTPKLSSTLHWFSQKYIENTLLTPWFYHKSSTGRTQ